MARTRAGLLDGALSVIEREGLARLTMSSVARRSGVAKATLYNHFRTKDDVVRELVRREVGLLADDAQSASARAALAGATPDGAAAAGLDRAAADLADHVAGRRVAIEEPGRLAAVLSLAEGGSWPQARSQLAVLLGVPPEFAVVALAARWLLGQLFDPQPAAVRQRTAVVVVAAARHEATMAPAGAAGAAGLAHEPAPDDAAAPGTG
jgi:AcrR family transcriptional regulator